MAVTRISDVVVPELWTPNFLLEDPALVAFFNSGLVQRDAQIDAFAKGEGSVYHIRHLNDLENVAENISNDDPADKSTPNKITSGEQRAVKLMRNNSWSSMDLVAALVDPDPVAAIRSRIANYWARRFQANVISEAKGILADNVANNGGDMLTTVAGTIDGGAFIDATAQMGDASGVLNGIVMHSKQYADLQKAQLIEYMRDADANINFPTYLGKRVVVDDGMPVEGAGTDRVFTAILFAAGAFRMGVGSLKTPTEVQRIPDAGNGEGQEVLYSRQHWIMHPRGFSVDAALSNPTNAQLELANSWDRVFGRKQVPFAFLKTK